METGSSAADEELAEIISQGRQVLFYGLATGEFVAAVLGGDGEQVGIGRTPGEALRKAGEDPAA